MKTSGVKKLAAGFAAMTLIFSIQATSVFAESLDDIVNGNQNQGQSQSQVVQEQTTPQPTPSVTQEVPNTGNENQSQEVPQNNSGTAYDYLENLQNTDLTAEQNQMVNTVNSVVYKTAQFIVQVISYALTVLLTVRVMLDLLFIAIPFSRGLLANGYAGNAQAGGGAGMQGGMGAMGGMGSMGGMGGFGMNRGGFGYNRMGAMGGMSGGMAGGPAGANQQGTMVGRIQWVSNAALNAVAAESSVDPQTGKAVSPFKIYVKDMAVTLVAVPILLVLAITGALTNLGFLIGKAVAAAIGKIGGMF